VNCGAKGLLGLGDRAREADLIVRSGNAIDGEALAGEPTGDLAQVRRAEAEACAELRWRQPLVILGRCWILEIDKELIKICLLRGGTIKAKGEVGELERFWRCTHIGSGQSAGRDGVGEGDWSAFSDGFGYTVLHDGVRSSGGKGKGEERKRKELTGEGAASHVRFLAYLRF